LFGVASAFRSPASALCPTGNVQISSTLLRFMSGKFALLEAFALSFYILFEGSLKLEGANLFADPFLTALKNDCHVRR
jgi:hypothetical protein